MLLNQSLFFIVKFLEVVSDGDKVQLVRYALNPCPREPPEPHIFLDDSECAFNLNGSLNSQIDAKLTFKVFPYRGFHIIPGFIDGYLLFILTILALCF